MSIFQFSNFKFLKKTKKKSKTLIPGIMMILRYVSYATYII